MPASLPLTPVKVLPVAEIEPCSHLAFPSAAQSTEMAVASWVYDHPAFFSELPYCGPDFAFPKPDGTFDTVTPRVLRNDAVNFTASLLIGQRTFTLDTLQATSCLDTATDIALNAALTWFAAHNSPTHAQQHAQDLARQWLAIVGAYANIITSPQTLPGTAQYVLRDIRRLHRAVLPCSTLANIFNSNASPALAIYEVGLWAQPAADSTP